MGSTERCPAECWWPLLHSPDFLCLSWEGRPMSEWLPKEPAPHSPAVTCPCRRTPVGWVHIFMDHLHKRLFLGSVSYLLAAG